MDSTPAMDLSNLSAGDRAELERFVTSQNQQMALNKVIGDVTDQCWKKCVPGKISGKRLDGREETCAQNCVSRWMEMQGTIAKSLTDSQQRGGLL